MKNLFEETENIKYKVLTLWQPWAALLAYGFKKIETRPSFTSWQIEKGTYLIHAASKWTSELDAISKQPLFREALMGIPIIRGAIIGSIDVFDCTPIIEDSNGYISLLNNTLLTETEIAFGHYAEGRYAWLCKNPKVLINPIPYKNGQGYYQNYKGDEELLIFK